VDKDTLFSADIWSRPTLPNTNWVKFKRYGQAPQECIVDRVIDAETLYLIVLGEKPTRVHLGREEIAELIKLDKKEMSLDTRYLNHFNTGEYAKPIGQLIGLRVHRRPEKHWLEVI
jgi:hypothetical protein